jgi:O-antigen ligase
MFADFGLTPATMAAVFATAALAALALLLLSLRHYSMAMLLVLLSPWIHWVFISNTETRTEEAGVGTYLRIAMVALAGIIGYAYYIVNRPAMNRPLPFRFFALAAFLLYALASTSYSIAPQFTIVRVVEAILFFGFLLGFYAWIDDKQTLDKALDIFAMLMAVGIVMNVLALPALPSRVWWWAAPNRYQGLMGQPNSLGAFCLLAYPLFFWAYGRSEGRAKYGWVFVLLCALAMHALSGSRSSFLAAGIGVFIWCLTLRQWMKVAMVGFCGVAGLLALSVLPQFVPSLQRNESESMTDLTGRDEFWVNAIELLKERPILGYGYEVEGEIWDDPRFAKGNLSTWTSARASLHNGYLSVAVGSGYAGLLLWLGILILPTVGLARSARSSPYKALILASLVQMLVANFLENAITSSRSVGSLGFWLFWVLAGKIDLVDAPQTADAGEPDMEMAAGMNEQRVGA